MYVNPKLFLITYDLKGQSTQYAKFYETIQNQGKWWHYLSSTWLISTTKDAKQMFEALHPFIQQGDYILIIEVGSEYWGLLPKEAWPWITEQLSASKY